MADRTPIKLVDLGSGQGSLKEFESGDTVSVSQGGTGGNTQATARLGLGLKSAAVIDAQTSVSDTTPGSALIVGAFGWNGGTCMSLPVTDVNTITTAGEYALGAGGTNLPNNAQAWYLHVVRHTTLVFQEVRGMTAVNASQVYTRVYTGSVWTSWASDFARYNILGTVSQSGGVPTGAIIEAGGNALGSFTKLADGTMTVIVRNAGPYAVAANTFTVLGPFSTPATFVDTTFSASAVAIPSASNDTYGVTSAYAVTTSSVSFVYRNGATAQNVNNIKITLSGRWF